MMFARKILFLPNLGGRGQVPLPPSPTPMDCRTLHNFNKSDTRATSCPLLACVDMLPSTCCLDKLLVSTGLNLIRCNGDGLLENRPHYDLAARRSGKTARVANEVFDIRWQNTLHCELIYGGTLIYTNIIQS